MNAFHPGEVAMQRRAGVAERMQELGPRVIRDHMPEQHREFFEQLPTLWVGSLDAQGRPWASMLSGWPGFIASPDARHLRVDASTYPGDPLTDALVPGTPLGLLGLEPATRRRNRANGRVVERDAEGFTLEVEQSFGNCPQYIQARSAQWTGEAAVRTPVTMPFGARLPAPLAALVARADTAFIASAAPGSGVDVSHRGGRPGFVRVDAGAEGTVLTMPDFRGNFYFNTIGNLLVNPWAGLLFVDFDSGGLLQLSARATLVEDGPELAAFTGAQRLLRLALAEGRWTPDALPYRWSAPQPAPQLAATGRW